MNLYSDFQTNMTANEKKLLRLIYQHRSISRPELLKLSETKIATLYRLIDSLLDKNILLVSKSDETNNIGRPSEILSLNGNYAYIISIMVKRSFVSVSIVDFNAKILKRAIFSCNENTTAQNLINETYSQALQLLDVLHIPYEKILVIGLTTFGTSKPQLKETIIYNQSSFNDTYHLYYPGFSWENFSYDIQSGLENIFKKTIHVDFLARSAAAGAYIEKKQKLDISGLAYILCDEGIGIGIVVDENILYGNTRIVNGIGRMVIDFNGSRCICGKYGCLETKATTTAITKNALQALKLGKPSILQKKIEHLTFSDICLAANIGDSLAKDVLTTAALAFCIAIENVLNLLDITMIVCGGIIPEQSPYFFSVIKKHLSQRLPWLEVKHEEFENDIITQGLVSSFLLNALK